MMDELSEEYYRWLVSDCFTRQTELKTYEGILRYLHDIPFYWTTWNDENRAGDAMSFRQYEFLDEINTEHFDQVDLGNWAMAAPSVLEVLLGMARRWAYYYEGSIPYFFQHMFRNMEFDKYPGRVLPSSLKDSIRDRVDIWLSRQFESDGTGSPFPVRHAFNIIDMTTLNIWEQMNAYSAEHFQ